MGTPFALTKVSSSEEWPLAAWWGMIAGVGLPSTFLLLHAEADEVVCVRTPEPFFAISLWYERFPQASDATVLDLLEPAEPAPSVLADTG